MKENWLRSCPLCHSVLSHFSRVQLFETLWTVAPQASLFIWFFRQEYWSRWPSHPPRDCPNPGTEPGSAALQADSLLLNQRGSPPFHSRCSRFQFRRCNRHGFDPWVGKIPGRRKMWPASILAWKLPWTEEHGRLQSMGSHMIERLSMHACYTSSNVYMKVTLWNLNDWIQRKPKSKKGK